jgi:alanine-synthesizing transaminase
LFETRQAILDSVAASRYLDVIAPRGSMYAFIRIKTDRVGGANFDDRKFALQLLEQKHVLVAPGSSFNVPYKDHFRATLLPQADLMRDVLGRVEALLDELAS